MIIAHSEDEKNTILHNVDSRVFSKYKPSPLKLKKIRRKPIWAKLDFNMKLILLIKSTVKNFRKIKGCLHKYDFKHWNCEIVRNYDEYNNFLSKNKEIAEMCQKINKQNIKHGIHEGEIHGICSFCDKKTNFIWKSRPQYSPNILFTEELFHTDCHMTARLRAVIHIFKIFEKNNPKNKKIYMYEQTTPFYENFRNCWGDDNEIIGSEYMGIDKKPGEIIKGIRHEDSTNLSFEDNELDYIISNDVFEHVPDMDLSLKEAKRCLKPGGKLIFRIPIEWNREKTFKRAEFKNGEITYLAEKIYHGGFQHDGSNGSLLVYNYGRDIFDIVKNAGFNDAYGIAILDKKYVNIDYTPILVFVCKK